jgi:hypothetical protein
MRFPVLYQTIWLYASAQESATDDRHSLDAGHSCRAWNKLCYCRLLKRERSLVFKNVLAGLVLLLLLSKLAPAHGEMTKVIVAYASPAATFCPGSIAKREGIFAKYNLSVEMVLMQGAARADRHPCALAVRH